MSQRGLLKQNAGVLELTQRLVDPLIVTGVGIIVYRILFGKFSFPEQYMFTLACMFLLCLSIFPFFDIYRFQRGASLWVEAHNLISAWMIIFAAIIVALFATKTGASFSRLWVGYWALSSLFALIIFRIFIRSCLRVARSHGYNLRFVAVAGGGELGRSVVRSLASSPWTGLKVIGIYDDDPRIQGKSIEGVPVRGGLHRLAREVSILGIDQVWIALPFQHGKQVSSLVAKLSQLPTQVTFVPDIYGFELLNHAISDIAGFPVIHLMQSPLSDAKGLIKSIEDKILASLVLLLASPLMLLITLGIKLTSPGPVFFRQLRGGQQGELFAVWKFRTMHHHPTHEQPVQAKKGDARITPFGAFLRRTSLDELPQFFNVLKGDMSIVGPRPHAAEHDEYYRKQIDAYMLRHHVKPGITGWAQINGWRGETEDLSKMEMRIKHDLYYIKNWSLWFDLRIIFLTIFIVIKGQNAH